MISTAEFFFFAAQNISALTRLGWVSVINRFVSTVPIPSFRICQSYANKRATPGSIDNSVIRYFLVGNCRYLKGLVVFEKILGLMRAACRMYNRVCSSGRRGRLSLDADRLVSVPKRRDGRV